MIIQGVTLNGVRVVDATFNTSNLVLHLDANQASSYSGSGTTVNDISGNGHTHTLTGATYTVLNGVKCFDCTTGNSRVVVNSTGPTLPTSGFTYTTWARLQPGDGSAFRTLLYTNSPKYTPITIPNNSNTMGYWDTAFRSSGYDLASAVDTWVQYAVVGDNSSQTFYINGVQAGNSIAQGPGGTTHWGWGNNDLAGQPWGHVANLQLYNTKLTAEKIQQNYYNQRSTFAGYAAPDYATSGIQMYYNPEDPSSYSGSGTTLADLSGNGYNATIVNGPTFSTNSLTLDGSNDYIASPNMVSSFNGSSAFSIEIWYAPNYTVQGDGGCIVQESGVATPNTSWYYAVMEHRKAPFGSLAYDYASIYTSSGLTAVNPLTTFNNLAWRQQILTYDGSSAKIYTNGSLARTVSLTRSTPWSNGYGYHLMIGAGTITNQSTKGNLNFKGKVGIVRAYNRALTSAEVSQNYNGAKGIYGLS